MNDTDFPVLFLPGTACDDRLFEPLLSHLGWENCHMGTFGEERSTAAAASRFLKEAPPVFDLVGFSLGGIVALEMVGRAPDRIRHLALLDTTARPDPESNAVIRRASVDRARQNGMETYILDVWPRLVSPNNVHAEDLQAVIVAMAVATGWQGLESQSEIAIHRENSLPRLTSIQNRTLVLAGQDDVVCPLEAQLEMATAIQKAHFVRIAGAGHFCPLEKPEETADHLRRWRMHDVDVRIMP